ncbi:MAG: ATP-binding protein [Chlamydiia bacterium]|nr:ATP-binding protein [Chlamydiia bacterium]
MKRLIDWHLKKWKNHPSRKPLLIRGARQVGKTHAIRKFGKEFKNLIEVNFELTPGAMQIFEKDLDPKRIIQQLSLQAKEDIIPGKTLLFFDEVQAAPQVLTALRYFYEKMPELHVIAAGSLLDFAIEQVGLPVGRVASLYMYPLSFMEFLSASGYHRFIPIIMNQTDKEEIGAPFHGELLDLLGQYFAIGGMPEAVVEWIKTNDPKASFEVHHQIIESYQMDFNKYAKKHQIKYLEQLFSQIPYLIGEQFQYKNIHGDYRKRELAPCMDLMSMAGVIHRIYHTAGQGLPLGAQINLEWFKVIFLDIAIAQAVLGVDLAEWFLKPGAAFVNKGMIAEAFVGQELLCYAQSFKKPRLFFWRRAEKNSRAEVDYIYEHEREVLPIEVKSGPGGKLRSLHLFLEKHPEVLFGLRFSTLDHSVQERIVSKPLYAVASIAHADQKEALLFLAE